MCGTSPIAGARRFCSRVHKLLEWPLRRLHRLEARGTFNAMAGQEHCDL